MMDDLNDANAHPGEQLAEILETFGHHVEPDLVEKLAASIRLGGIPWFLDEFAEAIRSGTFTPHIWGVLTQTGLDNDDFEEMDKDLRYIWSKVAPDRPYPGDER